MTHRTSIEDIIGIRSVKSGFFKEPLSNIRELQASNIALEQKRQDVQSILDSIPDVMAVLSLDFTLLSVNNAFRETYGIEDPCGKRCYEVFQKQQDPCSPCPVVMARKENCVYRQLQIIPIKGENRQLECTASLMLDADGKPSRAILLQRDVTLEKEYQTRYFQAEKMATIGVLAEGVAHEINNPLACISGFAEALTMHLKKLGDCMNRSPEGDELLNSFEDYLQTILMECNRCSEIVRNLLTFGHKEVSALSSVNLNNVVGNCFKLLQPRLSHLRPDILGARLSDLEPCVLGHPGELMQVVLNLVLNALYAVRESGEIAVSTAVEGGMAILRVADSGEGIPQENLNKLFEPFFSTKPAGQGIGIGLSSSYNIIKKHAGEIFVESIHGQGSVFIVTLPYLGE